MNPSLVVATANTYLNPNGSCGDSHGFTFYSHDGGQHWLQTTPLFRTPVSGDPTIAFDPVHNLFVLAYLEFDRNSGAGDVAVAWSADGATWSRQVALATNGAGFASVDKDWVTVDNNPSSPHFGRAAVTFTDFTAAAR